MLKDEVMIIQELFGLDGSEQLPLPETQRSFHRARLLAHIHTTLHMVSPDIMVYSLTSGLWSLFQRNLPLPNVPKKRNLFPRSKKARRGPLQGPWSFSILGESWEMYMFSTRRTLFLWAGSLAVFLLTPGVQWESQRNVRMSGPT